jgi:hypothetical protein
MATSTTALQVYKTVYWLLFTAIHIAITYTLFKMDRGIAAVIWMVIGFMLIFAMYSVYFPAGDPGSQWPPYVSGCPDYLTKLAPNACVDFVGLGSPQLKKSDPANPPGPADKEYIFDPSGTVAQKAARAQQYGLTWEGVF